jgi:CheY-like chemotaxis protein
VAHCVLFEAFMLQKLKPRILVIDDDPSVGVYLSRLFGETGRYSLEVETDSIAAIATARIYHPDLVLLDIFMPGLSGLEIAAQLRAEPRLRSRPIVFFTGKVFDKTTLATTAGDGPLEYLAKGTPGDEIVALADRLLAAAGS